jgi:hypothetical protein
MSISKEIPPSIRYTDKFDDAVRALDSKDQERIDDACKSFNEDIERLYKNHKRSRVRPGNNLV